VLHLLGDGPQREELRKLAGVHNIGGAVQIDLPIASAEMPGWYHSIDALVLPSRTRPNWKEQFGRVLVEAMACGVPVIGSDSGAIPEVVGPAGLIFPEGDGEALAAHLLRLIEDGEVYAALAQAGRQRVLNHFTQAQIAARTVEVYRTLMNKDPLLF
jgi:glycosyltransferase involved in cell wall biosynthesis